MAYEFTQDVSELLPGLYITSSYSVADFVRRMRQHDPTGQLVCVNTAKELIEEGFARLESTGGAITTCDWPLEDSPTQDLLTGGAIDRLVDQILLWLNEKRTVLVFCHMGISRSATLCVACMMKALNISSDEAIILLQRKRPVANPNVGFRAQLKIWRS